MAHHPRTALHRVYGRLRPSLPEKLEMCETLIKPNTQIVSYWNNDDVNMVEMSAAKMWHGKNENFRSRVSPLTSLMFSRMEPRSSSRGTRCFSSSQRTRRSDTNLRRLFLRTDRKRRTVWYHRCHHTPEKFPSYITLFLWLVSALTGRSGARARCSAGLCAGRQPAPRRPAGLWPPEGCSDSSCPAELLSGLQGASGIPPEPGGPRTPPLSNLREDTGDIERTRQSVETGIHVFSRLDICPQWNTWTKKSRQLSSS